MARTFRTDKTDKTDKNGPAEYGPLGPGSEPVKDPIKGLSGVLSGTLIMESITILLCLTVILKINDGELLSLIHI